MNNGSFDPNEYGNNADQQKSGTENNQNTASQQNAGEQPNYQQPNYQQPNYQQPNYQQPNYQQPYQAYQPPVQQPQQPAMGQAIAAMICGIASIVFCMLPAGIVAIILSNIAKKRGNTSGMATAGLITGIIGSIVSVIYIVYIVIVVVLATSSGILYY